MTSRSKPRQCTPRPDSAQGPCRPPHQTFDSLTAIIDDYLATAANDHTREVEHFGALDQDFVKAVDFAARGIWTDGTLHPHQRRVGHGALRSCANRLADHLSMLRDAEDFRELHDAIETLLRPIDRIGDLTIYDIAERIGWHLGFEPREIYLHCGTEDGARALVPGLRGKSAPMDRFPEALKRLSAAQAESMLCIYKKELWSLRDRGLL